jgi:hypothetical protein
MQLFGQALAAIETRPRVRLRTSLRNSPLLLPDLGEWKQRENDLRGFARVTAVLRGWANITLLHATI